MKIKAYLRNVCDALAIGYLSGRMTPGRAAFHPFAALLLDALRSQLIYGPEDTEDDPEESRPS